MRKLLYLLPLLALARPAAAQHTELTGRTGGNLSWYGGPAPDAYGSLILYDSGTGNGRANEPYGHRAGLGFGAGGRVLRVTRPGLLLAFDLGYDWQQARARVSSLYDGNSDLIVNRQYDADGHSSYRTQQVTGFLGVGYRLPLGGFALDALAGPELAGVLGGHETGSGSYDGRDWRISRRDPANALDARLRAELTLWHNRTGLTASYSHGFTNYYGQLVGGHAEAYSRTLRLGVAYRLR